MVKTCRRPRSKKKSVAEKTYKSCSAKSQGTLSRVSANRQEQAPSEITGTPWDSGRKEALRAHLRTSRPGVEELANPLRVRAVPSKRVISGAQRKIKVPRSEKKYFSNIFFLHLLWGSFRVVFSQTNYSLWSNHARRIGGLYRLK